MRCFFSFFCSSETNCVQLAVEFHSRFNPTPHSAEKVKFLCSSLHALLQMWGGRFWPWHCAYVIMNLCRPIHTAFSSLFSTASPCLLLPFATFSCMSAPLSPLSGASVEMDFGGFRHHCASPFLNYQYRLACSECTSFRVNAPLALSNQYGLRPRSREK